jgi:threonine aldolase
MLSAMVEARVGDDVFGDDPSVNELEAMAASMTGKEMALFVPSGTMGNQIAIRVHTRPGDEMLVEQSAHTFLYEAGAPAALSGVQTWPIPSAAGLPSIEDVEARLRPDDAHCPPTSLLCLENTHNRLGGRVVPLEDLTRLADFARSRGLRVHLDGARIFNAQAATDIPVNRWAAPVDSMMFCLSKALSAPVGSMLVGNREFVTKARRVRKQLGGGMRQAGYLAAAGIVALREMPSRLAADHDRARRLAQGIEGVPGLRQEGPVETNIVLLRLVPEELPEALRDAPSLARRMEEEGVAIFVFAPDVIRLTTHKDVGDEDVERAIATLGRVLRGVSAASPRGSRRLS